MCPNNSSKFKLDIVLPFHNSEKFILHTVQSILRQTFGYYRLILVNDNSQDGTLEIIKKIEDNRIVVISNKGSGAVDAYNTGLEYVKTDFVFIADHDDLFAPSLIEKEYNALKNNKKISLVSSYFIIVDENNKEINRIFFPTSHIAIQEKMKYQCSIANSGSMVRREIFDKYGYFNKEYFPAHDYEFYLRILDKVEFHNIPEYLIRWRSVSTSPSQKQFSEQRKKSFESINKYFNAQLDKNNISVGEYNFCIGRATYYHISVIKSSVYFFKSIIGGYYDYFCLKYLFKATFFWMPIKFYRDWLVKNKFNRNYKYDF